MFEKYPLSFGKCKDKLPVRQLKKNIMYYLLPKQERPFLMAGRTEIKTLTGEKDKIIMTAFRIQAFYSGKSYRDNEFDAVLAYHSLYHLDTPGMGKAIRELFRVMETGGRNMDLPCILKRPS